NTSASNTKPSTGAATLDWTPPTENSDGSALTDLAGYTVYYGTSPNNLTQSVKLGNPGLTAYTMTNLPAGTWYFSVTAYSTTGAESARSGVISATI
ncbi:MAG: fibronectin type III domain-containing protein, partial [Sinobacteraceae bacterium]|nr:fibronectin type III domain-containing protein [Nevskiaceae bacterium]